MVLSGLVGFMIVRHGSKGQRIRRLARGRGPFSGITPALGNLAAQRQVSRLLHLWAAAHLLADPVVGTAMISLLDQKNLLKRGGFLRQTVDPAARRRHDTISSGQRRCFRPVE